MPDASPNADLLKTFGRGFFRADESLLRASTTPDFEWHLHAGSASPDGRVVRGIAETMEVIRWRRENWSDVHYSEVEASGAGSLLVQTFRVSGTAESGAPFNARGVDLYRVESGRIARKDSFWKQVAGTDAVSDGR